jgi:hypothetical protein
LIVFYMQYFFWFSLMLRVYGDCFSLYMIQKVVDTLAYLCCTMHHRDAVLRKEKCSGLWSFTTTDIEYCCVYFVCSKLSKQ